MRRVLVYGAVVGAAAVGLTWLDFQQLARAYPFHIYGALIGAAFLVVGVVVGTRLGKAPEPPPFDGNPQVRHSLGLSSRELEVLELLARGRSTQEVAEELHISASTVKTHVARLFDKLEARRRTDAVNKARELGIIR